MTTRLENVLASHSKMQGSREKFQIKLVRIASDIAMLTKERYHVYVSAMTRKDMEALEYRSP